MNLEIIPALCVCCPQGLDVRPEEGKLLRWNVGGGEANRPLIGVLTHNAWVPLVLVILPLGSDAGWRGEADAFSHRHGDGVGHCAFATDFH